MGIAPEDSEIQGDFFGRMQFGSIPRRATTFESRTTRNIYFLACFDCLV